LALGEGARMWLAEAASAGTSRVKVKMAEAVQLARLHGDVSVDWARGHAVTYARFADGDAASILAAQPVGDRHAGGANHSLPGRPGENPAHVWCGPAAWAAHRRFSALGRPHRTELGRMAPGPVP
jgi:hypothetical protein